MQIRMLDQRGTLVLSRPRPASRRRAASASGMAIDTARAQEARLAGAVRRSGMLGLFGFLTPALRTGVGRFVPGLHVREEWLWLEVSAVVVVLGAATYCLAHRERASVALQRLRQDIFSLQFLQSVAEHERGHRNLALLPHPYREGAAQAVASRVTPPSPRETSSLRAGGRPPLRVILGTLKEPESAPRERVLRVTRARRRRKLCGGSDKGR